MASGMRVDLITAGFPCQDVSVAGQRKGLAGERSGLFWEIIRVARGLRPGWLLLENVPGLFSSHRGRDFGIVLTALDELGYGVAWTVLDAQYAGLAQRRERVFLVGHLGAPCPPEILFEPEGVSGNPPPRREARAGITQSLTRSLGAGGADDNDAQGRLIVARPITSSSYKRHDEDTDTIVTHALRSEGADASEDGTGRGTPLAVVPILEVSGGSTSRGDGPNGAGIGEEGDPMFTLQSAHQHAVMFSDPRRHDVRGLHRGDIRGKPSLNATNNDLLLAPTLRVGGREQGAGSSSDNTPIVFATQQTPKGFSSKVAPTLQVPSASGGGQPTAVLDVRPRRLTPRECERLQGFPDDWTLIAGASDSSRYRALGNAVAPPVAEWILRRIPAETVGELFCGIGGFGLAARRTGKSVVWASEIEPFCRRVYAARFPDVTLLGDVREVGA